jgi:hypothetical protein
MQRSRFSLSSMSSLGSFLSILIQVMILLTGTFSVSLPFLKFDMLYSVAVDGAPVYVTALGEFAQGV